MHVKEPFLLLLVLDELLVDILFLFSLFLGVRAGVVVVHVVEQLDLLFHLFLSYFLRESVDSLDPLRVKECGRSLRLEFGSVSARTATG